MSIFFKCHLVFGNLWLNLDHIFVENKTKPSSSTYTPGIHVYKDNFA